ncbi:hypothetical protein BaRGS_00010169, partial [Batillaria attramentaria]
FNVYIMTMKAQLVLLASLFAAVYSEELLQDLLHLLAVFIQVFFHLQGVEPVSKFNTVFGFEYRVYQLLEQVISLPPNPQDLEGRWFSVGVFLPLGVLEAPQHFRCSHSYHAEVTGWNSSFIVQETSKGVSRHTPEVKNACPPGQELTEDGGCTECPIGFYKPSSETLCGPCDIGLVTNFTGADSQDDCNVADNQPGYYRQRPDVTVNAPCPIGTYQPDKWQYDCISCGGDRYRTDRVAAVSASECRFFCPAGQERVGTEDQCKPCDVGFYRTGDNPYSSCALCPNNTRTLTTGSITVADCDIYKCPAGQRPASNQEVCEYCPRGTYQPLNDQTDCIQCPGAKQDTRTAGSKFLADCETYCDPGYEKASNGSCFKCPIGFYKDNTIDNFHTCTRCTDVRYVTPFEGATSDTQCTIQFPCTEGRGACEAKTDWSVVTDFTNYWCCPMYHSLRLQNFLTGVRICTCSLWSDYTPPRATAAAADN